MLIFEEQQICRTRTQARRSKGTSATQSCGLALTATRWRVFLFSLCSLPLRCGEREGEGVEGCGRSQKITSSVASCVYQQISARSGITLHQFLTKAKQVVAYYRAASQALHTTTGKELGQPPHTHTQELSRSAGGGSGVI